MSDINLLALPKAKFTELVGEVLKDYRDGDLFAVSQSPLAESSLVEPCFLQGEGVSSDVRGRAMQAVLRWAVDRLRPGGEHSWIASRWRAYNVIYYFYLEEMRIADLADKMAVAEPTWYQARTQALATIASILEEELSNPQYTQERKNFAIADRYTRYEPTSQQILRIASIFRYPIRAELLYHLATKANLGNIQTYIQQLLRGRLLVANEQGTEFLASPEIRSYLLTLLSLTERQTWHKEAAFHYKNDRNYLEAAWHFRAAGTFEEAALILVENQREIIDNLDINTLQEMLATFRFYELEDKNLWCRLKIVEGKVADYLEDVDTALERYGEALGASDVKIKAQAYHHRAKALEGKNLDEALAHYNYCVDLLEENHPQDMLLPKVLINMAWIFIQEQQDFRNAEELLNRAERHIKQNKGKQNNRAIWSDLQNAWGQLRYRQNQLKAATNHQFQAWLAANEVQDVERMINTGYNLGNFHTEEKRFEQALDYLERSQKLANQAGNRTAEGACTKAIGACYFFLEDYPKTITHYQQAYAIFTDIGHRLWQASTCYDLAEVYAMVDNALESKKYFEEGVALAKKLEYEELLNAFNDLYQSHSGLTPPTVDLNDRQIQALEFVKENAKITNREYRQLTGISQKQAVRDLTDLIEKGVLEATGKGRGRHYILP